MSARPPGWRSASTTSLPTHVPRRGRAEAAARFLIEHELAERAAADAGLTRLSTTTDPEIAFLGIALVLECAREELQVKRGSRR